MPANILADQLNLIKYKKKLERLYLLPLPLRENPKKVIRSRSVNKFSFSDTYEAYSKPSMIKPRHKTESANWYGVGPKHYCMASRVLALNLRPRFEFSLKLRDVKSNRLSVLKLFRL